MILALVVAANAQPRPRARGLGVQFEGTTGPMNAITDVAGVEVGHRTIVSGDNVRTGVTAVWPRGKQSGDPVFGGFFSQNGNGDMTGTHWLEESGFLDGPVLITNTHSVGVVRDAYLAWLVKNKRVPGTNVFPGGYFTYPIVAETYDGFLNDINGFHVKAEDVAVALDSAAAGAVSEGNVGGGTGMICHDFKGGIGTASRIVETPTGRFTVGALVQANHGDRELFRVDGVPVGRTIDAKRTPVPWLEPPKEGSIIVIIATDAPLLAVQCKRLARRATIGLARVGSVAHNGSGDIFLGFATGNHVPSDAKTALDVKMLPHGDLNYFFEAVAEAVEESILNALCAAETMTGYRGRTAHALPLDEFQKVMEAYRVKRPRLQRERRRDA
jgi:L-aminopeptidase/D-esterase-like protein